MKLNNKKIIVTGAGSGIGKSLTLQLLEKGAYVFALDINNENLKELNKIVNDSNKLFIYQIDLEQEAEIEKFCYLIKKNNIIVDGIINNAGIIQPFQNLEQLSNITIKKIININFYAPLLFTKLLIPDLKIRPEAAIVNVSSMGGFFPFPGQSVYGASKAALKLLTEGIYSELLNTNISVLVVMPGAVDTDIVKNSNVNISNTNSKMALTSPIKAASLIIKAIEKNKYKLYIGKDAKIMNFLYKISPKYAIKKINRLMKKALGR